MPRGVAGIGREQASQVAEPGRPEQRVGDGVERDVAVGMAVQTRGSRRSRSRRAAAAPRSERVAVVADPRPSGRSAVQERVARGRGPRAAVTFRLPGRPGRHAPRRPSASSSAASSVQVSGPSGRTPEARVAAGPAPHALGRLGGAEPGPIDRLADEVAVDPLERLGDRQRPGSPRRVGRRRGDRTSTSAAVTSGRAPSWTRTTRHPRSPASVQGGEPGLRPTPGGARRRRPRRRPGPAARCVRDRGHAIGRGHDHDPLDLGRRRDRVERPGEQRPSGDLDGELVRATHPLDRPAATTIMSTAGRAVAASRHAAGP